MTTRQEALRNLEQEVAAIYGSPTWNPMCQWCRSDTPHTNDEHHSAIERRRIDGVIR